MTDRRGFVLDTKSMSYSETPSTSGQPALQAERSQEAPQQDRTGNVKTEFDVLKQYSGLLLDEENKDHPGCNASIEPIATEHFRRLLEEQPGEHGDAHKINLEQNKIFLKRLQEIDSLDSRIGDSKYRPLQLRLITFQEWVDFLLQVNSLMFANLSALEDETYSKVMSCVHSVDGQQQQMLDDNRKLRSDINAITKLLQNAYHRNTWAFSSLSLETLSVHQLLGITRDQPLPESESEKMAECMKSLVNEMASKHDEVCHLKSQLCALDEVVLTARQKLILKDQCIAQLNQQLQKITECLASVPQPVPFYEMPKEGEEERVGDLVASCFLEKLTVKDKQESHILKILNRELNDLLEMHSRHEIQSVETCRNRLYSFFENFSKELFETTRNLENVRNHLNLLRNDVNKPGSDPYSTPISAVCSDPDGAALEALRRQLQNYNNTTKEMHCNYLLLLEENKELHSKLESESLMNTRSGQVLKGLAEKFVEMGLEHFTYKEIYETTSTSNPFCAALNELCVKNEEKVAVVEQQLVGVNQRLADQITRLQGQLGDRDAEVSQLQKMIHSYSDFSENQRLKEEIHSLKQAQSAQLQKIREMASLLKNREDQRAELFQEHEQLTSNYEDQGRELKKSKKRQQSLEESVCRGEKELETITVERNLLRDEVTSLKEKEAKATGRERAFCDQEKISQKELANSRRIIQSLQDHVKQGQQKHREAIEQLQVDNSTMSQQLRDFEAEIQQMRAKLKQQADVNQQQEEIISSFRQWKDAQIRVDEAKRQCDKRAEGHIKQLMEENQMLVYEYRCLHRDYSLLEAEIQRVKQAIHRTTSPPAFSSQPDCARVPPQMGDEQMTNRMRILANTSQRLAIHSKMLNDHSVQQNQPSLRKSAQQEQEDQSLSRNTQPADSPLLEQHP